MKKDKRFNSFSAVHIYLSNGYMELYTGTYYPEYKGTEKEFDSKALFNIEMNEDGVMRFVTPCRYC